MLADRYYLSSFAYNGGFVPLDWVIELNRPAMEIVRPDLTLYLDLSAEDCMRRVARRGDTERYESIERQTLIRARYLELIARFQKDETIAVVKSEARKEDTHAAVLRAVEQCFGGSL